MAATQSIDVVMPQMGVSVSEGTITKWLKQEGDPVAADESLLEISTDKVDTEVPSPGSGVVQQILVQEGETVEVGTKLAVIAPEGAAPAEEAPAPAEEAPAEEAPAPAEEAPAEEAPAPGEKTPAPAAEAPAPPEPATHEAAAESAAPSSSEGETPAPEGAPPAPPTEAPAPAAPPEPAVADGDGAGERTFVSPVVARIASEHGVDVSQVSGTGRGGRVTKKDILAFVESGGAQQQEQPAAPVQPEPQPQLEQQIAPAPRAEPAAPQAPPQPPAPPAPAAAPPKPQPVAQAAPEAGETVEPVNAMRRGIAEHMRRSLDTSAHVTSAIEVDMSNVVSIRKKLKGEYQRSYGVNPTYLSFIARAAVETLRDYPWINGELRGDQIVTRNYVNLGFAVELADGKGLIVPVLKHAEGLNLLGMARSVSEIAQRAREKKLLPDDVQGGTFTITNPGGYGTFHGTPVISQPQAAILGTYAVVKRPWVIQDDRGEDVIAIRPIMNLTLTYDHRLVDGALAGRFLRDLRERLETWDEENY